MLKLRAIPIIMKHNKVLAPAMVLNGVSKPSGIVILQADKVMTKT